MRGSLKNCLVSRLVLIPGSQQSMRAAIRRRRPQQQPTGLFRAAPLTFPVVRRLIQCSHKAVAWRCLSPLPSVPHMRGGLSNNPKSIICLV